ncbi:MAG: glutamate--cysteine ligase [archaeon]
MINGIARMMEQKKDEVDAFFEKALARVHAPIYASFDVRHAGFKAAVIDANAFASGFNNLSCYCQEKARKGFTDFLKSHHPEAKRIMLVGEAFTRNTFYLENLHVLADLLLGAGYDCIPVSFSSEIENEVKTFPTAAGREISLHRPIREGAVLRTGDFVPDIVMLNNSIKGALPAELVGLETPIYPNPTIGWYHRRKSGHFEAANRLLGEFADAIGIDPWLVSTIFESQDDVDFKEKTGLDRIAKSVDKIIAQTKKKYDEHGIKDTPFVFVKNNAGEMGTAITQVESGQEILDMNSKERRKMDIATAGVKVTSVVIQEGIPTIDLFDGITAEEVMMTVGSRAIGGFFRYNRERNDHQNLNAAGMQFQPDILCARHWEENDEHTKSNLALEHVEVFKALSLISAIAMGHEEEELLKDV